MRYKGMLFGTLIGFSIVFFVRGFWTEEFDWGWWISMLLGGTIGFVIFAFIVGKKTD